MHDWEAIVRGRLGDLRLSEDTERDVVREVASHFEQMHEDARESGLTDEEARERALESVADWEHFRRALRREKGMLTTMSPWKHKVGLPGLTALALGVYAFILENLVLPQSWHRYSVIWVKDVGPLQIDITWALTVPFIGAAAAWLARRNGAARWQRALAAIFPSLLWMAVILTILSAEVAARLVRPAAFQYAPSPFTLFSRVGFFPWALTPAVALLIGAMPFLFGDDRSVSAPPKERHG